MGNGSGVSRGDRNRNARLERLRALVPGVNAIVGIDLADARCLRGRDTPLIDARTLARDITAYRHESSLLGKSSAAGLQVLSDAVQSGLCVSPDRSSGWTAGPPPIVGERMIIVRTAGCS
jgi:hypothetical protein